VAAKRRGPDGLTDKERAICLAVDAGLTDKEAFRKACPNSRATNHSASVGAARVRKLPHCVAYLKQLQENSLLRHARHKDRVIEELANIAFADAGDLFEWGPEGVTIKDVASLTPAQRRLISIASKTKHGAEGTARLDLRSKLQALDKLCHVFGLYAPDPRSIEAKERAIAERAHPMSDVERAQRLAAILREAESKENG